MKVFFDGNIFTSQKQGGISRVGFELMKNLNAFKDVEKIFYRGLYIDNYPFQSDWFKHYYGLRKPDTFNYRALNLLDVMGMELAYWANASTDVIFHSLFYRVPKNPKGPVVVHAYDMTHELFGGGAKSIAFKKRAFEKADLIVAISQSTKRDLVRLYPQIHPNKVVVVYLGISEAFLKPNDFSGEVKSRPYVLYVGPRNYGYKNFELLLDVFIEKRYFLDFDLVVAGGEKEVELNQQEKIKMVTGRNSWFFHKFGSDQDLARLYSKATALVYPSLYEGFGLPPLEAMASGCPVLASNASSIPEVVGDAGLLFDVNDKNDFTDKLGKILQDRQLQLMLKEKGHQRVGQFTWQKMADAMHLEYQKLVKKDRVN